MHALSSKSNKEQWRACTILGASRLFFFHSKHRVFSPLDNGGRLDCSTEQVTSCEGRPYVGLPGVTGHRVKFPLALYRGHVFGLDTGQPALTSQLTCVSSFPAAREPLSPIGWSTRRLADRSYIIIKWSSTYLNFIYFFKFVLLGNSKLMVLQLGIKMMGFANLL